MSEATVPNAADPALPRRSAVTLGVIVNPIAGMGGRVGLKGTDGAARLRRAIELGAPALAGARASRALARLVPLRDRVKVCAPAGPMGSSITEALNLDTAVVGTRSPERASVAEDTRIAAVEMAARGVDLLLFAGGDGTARDIYDATAGAVPVLGVPAGVKMYSGVFARNPQAAGDAALSYLQDGGSRRLVPAEVVDLDEDADWRERTIRIYGQFRVPAGRSHMVGAKAQLSSTDDANLDALCAQIVDEMQPATLYILGPGTTIGRIRRLLGMEDRLLCVDAVRDGRPVGLDLREAELLELLGDAPAARVLAGVIGGQGSLFGRGNQQISAAVLSRVGTENIEVICGEEKLLAVDPSRLHVDTGDVDVDRMLCGYRQIRVAPQRSVVVEVAA